MDSQKLLGNVVDSLRVRTKPQPQAGVGSQSAGVKAGLASSSAPVLDQDEVRTERGGGVPSFMEGFEALLRC